MALREQAIAAAERHEGRRIDAWREPTVGPHLLSAYGDATDGFDRPRLKGPLESGLTSLAPDWLDSTAVAVPANSEDQDALWFLWRTTSGEAPTTREEVELYVIDACPRCSQRVPVGGPVSSVADVGRALLSGLPVGHVCPALWTPDG